MSHIAKQKKYARAGFGRETQIALILLGMVCLLLGALFAVNKWSAIQKTRTALAYEPGPRGLFFENFSVFPESVQRSLMARQWPADHELYSDGLRYWHEHRGTLLERMKCSRWR